MSMPLNLSGSLGALQASVTVTGTVGLDDKRCRRSNPVSHSNVEKREDDSG